MWSIWLVFCDYGFHSVCPLRDKDKRLWKIPPGRDWLWGKLGLVLMGWAMFSKSLIQFSIDGRGCVHSLLFDLRPNYGGVMKIMATSFERSHACTPVLSAPDPTWVRPPLTHASTRDSWTLTGKFGSVSCEVTAPFSWVLVHTRFCLCPPRILCEFWWISPVLCELWWLC